MCGEKDPFLRLASQKLVRIVNGRRVVVTRGDAATLVGGRLTEAGLFYAYNAGSGSLPGRIGFEPMGKLLARF